MSEEFDEELRAALRPVDPGETFTQGVMARIAAEATRAVRAPRPRGMAFRWTSAGLAVSLMIGLLLAHERQVRRTERGIEAREQLLQALRMTGEKLDFAYRVVNAEERSEPRHAD